MKQNAVTKAVAVVKKVREAAPVTEKRKYRAYELRIQGWDVTQIAHELNVTRDQVYKYLRAVHTEQPEIRQVVEEFLRLTLIRLEMQYAQLADLRADGDVMAHKVSAGLIELEGKFLGSFTQNVNVNQTVTYEIDGVDMGDV